MNRLSILWAFLLCSPASSTVALAQFQPGSTVTFKTKDSRLCIGVDGASVEDNKRIGHFPCGDDKAPNQRWRVERRGDGFQFRNVKSHKCFGVDNASTNPNVDILQFPCDGSANQTWKPRGKDNIWVLHNAKSDLCLGVPHAQLMAQQMECNVPGTTQEWRLVTR
ncbi:MAG: RICIN domain-containing protein [Bryobacterales bacterium]|nr:RICIN domain-containing protein [Bryobacterales bacterium]